MQRHNQDRQRAGADVAVTVPAGSPSWTKQPSAPNWPVPTGASRAVRLPVRSAIGVTLRAEVFLAALGPLRMSASVAEVRSYLLVTARTVLVQAVALGALEPEWEARFEPKSYGFRPGRGCHDAIGAIYSTLNGKNPQRVWVLDADLTAAFDHIDHDRLMAALGRFRPELQVRASRGSSPATATAGLLAWVYAVDRIRWRRGGSLGSRGH